MMKLYHGTNCDFQQIDLKKCKQIKILDKGSILQISSVRRWRWLSEDVNLNRQEHL